MPAPLVIFRPPAVLGLAMQDCIWLFPGVDAYCELRPFHRWAAFAGGRAGWKRTPGASSPQPLLPCQCLVPCSALYVQNQGAQSTAGSRLARSAQALLCCPLCCSCGGLSLKQPQQCETEHLLGQCPQGFTCPKVLGYGLQQQTQQHKPCLALSHGSSPVLMTLPCCHNTPSCPLRVMQCHAVPRGRGHVRNLVAARLAGVRPSTPTCHVH